MRAKAFEIGQIYGGLKILDSHYKGTAHFYTVECQECGGIYDAQVPGIRKGCRLCRAEKEKEARRKEHEKMVGKQYGDLVVTGVEVKPYGPSTAYRVNYRCIKCGYEGKILPYKLRDGITTSCPRCGKRGRSKREKEISVDNETGKYQVTVDVQLYVGSYDTLEEAMQAHDRAQKRIEGLWNTEREAQKTGRPERKGSDR